MPQCHGQHVQCMEFALQTEQQGKGSPTELVLHELQAETPAFTGDYASWGSTATPSSPTHPWGAREGCYGLRRDLLGAGGAEPTAGCNMQLVPTSPAATWGGADRASTVRHREEMCCCWRNFKLGKSWDPSPRPCGDGSLTWSCCSASEPQTPSLQPQMLLGPAAGSEGGFPAPPEGVSAPHCSSGSTRWLQGSQVWGQALSIPLLLPHSWLLSPDPHGIVQRHRGLAG